MLKWCQIKKNKEFKFTTKNMYKVGVQKNDEFPD